MDPIFNLLLAKKAKLNVRTKAGYGPMHLGVLYPDFLRIIKQAGASIDDRNPITGETPIIFAARIRAITGMEWLSLNGANLKLKDKAGKTAGDYASEYRPRRSK